MLILSVLCMTLIVFAVIYVSIEEAEESSLTEKVLTLCVVGIPWSYLVGQLIQSII